MGLLDDLKKQAESLKGDELSKTALMQNNIAATDSALRKANSYLVDLCKQLNVLKPESKRVYQIDTVGELSGFSQGEFFCDYRLRDVEGKEVFGQVLLNFRCTFTKPVEIRRNFDQIDAFRKLMARFSLKYTSVPFKNERGVVMHEIFSITGDFLVQVLWEGEHINGTVKVTAKHLSEFGFVAMAINCREFNENTLEEFAKIVLGAPSQFWKLGKRVAFTAHTSMP
jgi:hypothetical protein